MERFTLAAASDCARGAVRWRAPDFRAQAKQALGNLAEIIKAAWGMWAISWKTAVLLADINDYAEFNEL